MVSGAPTFRVRRNASAGQSPISPPGEELVQRGEEIVVPDDGLSASLSLPAAVDPELGAELLDKGFTIGAGAPDSEGTSVDAMLLNFQRRSSSLGVLASA